MRSRCPSLQVFPRPRMTFAGRGRTIVASLPPLARAGRLMGPRPRSLRALPHSPRRLLRSDTIGVLPATSGRLSLSLVTVPIAGAAPGDARPSLPRETCATIGISLGIRVASYVFLKSGTMRPALGGRSAAHWGKSITSPPPAPEQRRRRRRAAPPSLSATSSATSGRQDGYAMRAPACDSLANGFRSREMRLTL